jgi:glycine/D-amino acid oxidase-like deaminating enzyme
MNGSSHGLWARSAPASPATRGLSDDIRMDVVVIGAGYTGLSAALHLAERGVSVAVLEAAQVGFGGSGRNVGLVNAGLWVMPEVVIQRLGGTYGPRLLDLLGEAPGLVFELIARHGIACEPVRAGTLHCGIGRGGFEQLEERARQWSARRAPVELLGPADAALRTGSKAFSGALFDARAGTVQPLAYARGLARAAMAKGTALFTDSAVLNAKRDGGMWIVRTSMGSARAEWVVIATDAYAEGPWRVAREEQVHLPYFNFATAPLDEPARKSILPGGEGAWDTRKVLSSFRLDAAGRLIFGSVGSLRARGPDVHRQWAKRSLGKLFPQLGRVEFEDGWYGHIGMTADSLPRFHEYAPRVIGFSGYNGRGIAPGTVFGAMLADLICGERQLSELPLPVTEPKVARFRELREGLYRVGAEALHWTSDRY